MTHKEINAARGKVKSLNPLVHAITNPISINQCANAVLAVGARPIMAEHPAEVTEITKTAKALMLNLGNITDVRIESMKLSANTAEKEKIPVMLDLVGVACSTLRRKLAEELVDLTSPCVIKGNYSEISAFYDKEYKSSGVDSENELNLDYITNIAVKLAINNNAVILASGKTDVITDGKRIIYINNGTPRLSTITGTGCMLGALCACYLTVSDSMSAASAACAVLGISGELSENFKGAGSFLVNLMDNISTLKNSDLGKHLKMEERKVENV